MTRGGLAAWEALEEAWRSHILEVVGKLAAKRAKADRDGCASFPDDPKVEIYACTGDREHLTVHYLFHWWEYCPAQSGSDWNWHSVYCGTASFDGDTLTQNDIEALRRDYVHEYQEEHYDREGVVSEVRSGLRDRATDPNSGSTTADDESIALSREIARHPDDLSLRDAWAALAERRGDHSRARLVREQLARRRERAADHLPFVSAVEKELLAAHPEWSQELAQFGVSEGTLSGGFVESIVVDAATLLALAPAILEGAPIRAVRIIGDVGLVPQLVQQGVLERICWLDLADLRIDEELLASLATSNALRALGLARTGLTDALVETIWASFPRLLVCEIEGNPCDDLVTQELTYQEMSRYEWFMTARANALEAKYGPRSWIYPSEWPGADRPDLEQLLAWIAQGR